MSKNILLSGIALFIFLLSNSFAAFAQDSTEEIIKVDVAMVNIPVIVSDKSGRYISSLTINNFELYVDGKLQKIEYLSNQEIPLNIVILVDTSRSTQEIFERLQNAAKEFIKQLQPADRCMVISFSNKVQVESEFTSNPKVLARTINNIRMSEKFGTLLHDAIFATVDKELSSIMGRKAIILLTDGKDAGSSINKIDLIHRLEESDSPIYSVIYETSNIPFINNTSLITNASNKIKKNQQGQDVKQLPNNNANFPPTQKPDKKNQALQQKKHQEVAEFFQKISEATAGRFYPKEINDIDVAFKNIANELRMQYSISYYPEDTNYDSSRHQIKIKVNKSNVIVRAKNFYKLR